MCLENTSSLRGYGYWVITSCYNAPVVKALLWPENLKRPKTYSHSLFVWFGCKSCASCQSHTPKPEIDRVMFVHRPNILYTVYIFKKKISVTVIIFSFPHWTSDFHESVLTVTISDWHDWLILLCLFANEMTWSTLSTFSSGKWHILSARLHVTDS